MIARPNPKTSGEPWISRVMRIVVAVLALGVPALANALATYSYTGNPFTTFSPPITSANFISGSFSVDSPLADGLHDLAIAPPAGFTYSFTDGLLHTASSSSPTAVIFSFRVTLTAGAINAWNIHVADGVSTGADLFTTAFDNVPTLDATLFMGPAAITVIGSSFTPGTWTIASAVPEPESYAILLVGFGLLVFSARRRKQKQAA